MSSFVQNLDLQQKGVWFPIGISTVILLFILLMPKRQMNWRSMYLTFGLVGYVGFMLDINIIGQYLDWFDIGDPHKEGLGDLAAYGLLPASLAVAFLNYFDRSNKWPYVAFFTVISFLFEWELTKLGYMKLKGWQTWYSIPVYIVVYAFWLPWHFELMQKIYRETSEAKAPSGSLRALRSVGTQPAMKPLDPQSEKQNDDT